MSVSDQAVAVDPVKHGAAVADPVTMPVLDQAVAVDPVTHILVLVLVRILWALILGLVSIKIHLSQQHLSQQPSQLTLVLVLVLVRILWALILGLVTR
jgi:hypothetical protein